MHGLAGANVKYAQQRWGRLSEKARVTLREFTAAFRVSVLRGDIVYLDQNWYVTHSGLLGIARRNRCQGIHLRPAVDFCEPANARWAFEATVYTSRACRGFVGYGDANPSNVSALVRGAEMRVAETRAVNRALRKAYGIGICSIEELRSFSGPLPPAARSSKSKETNADRNHPLRDRLCLLIRQHQLDPALVKAYAADYCDVSKLRQASREQVATFIKHLAEYAQSNREGLICQLNSYAPKPVCSATAPATIDAPSPEQEKAAGAA